MALPKPIRPEYSTKIPSTGKTIKFVPFSVKEEKVLILASESKDMDEIGNAISNVLESCVTSPNFKVKDLALFDIELLFLKTRAKSVGEKLEVKVTDPNDPTYSVAHELDVDKISVKTFKGHTNKIELGSDTVVIMKYPGMDYFVEGVPLKTIVERLDVAAKCIEQIVIGEDVYNRDEMTDGEAEEWLEGLTSDQFTKVMDFFMTMPRLSHTFNLTNKNTKETFSITLEGLADFF